MDQLQLTTTHATDAAHARVEVAGVLDLVGSPQLRRILRTHLDEGRRHITVDLSGLTFLDAAGIGVFLESHLACQSAGGRLVLVCVPELARRLLELVNLDRELHLADDAIPVAATTANTAVTAITAAAS
jgi:anti-sigma B factor antagonist